MLIAGCKPRKIRKRNRVQCEWCDMMVLRRERCRQCDRMVCKSCLSLLSSGGQSCAHVRT